MTTQPQDGVTIGLREIYDMLVRTHEAVQSYGPRLDAIEKVSGEAHKTATDAMALSATNAKHIGVMWRAVTTISAGTIIAFVTAWASHHIF